MLQGTAGLWVRMGTGDKHTPLLQSGWGELSTGKLSARPQLSAGCFGLRASPKPGQSTQSWQLEAFIAKVPIARCFPNSAAPQLGRILGSTCPPEMEPTLA